MKSLIDALRVEMKKRGIKAYFIPNTDEFGNEYLPDSAKRLEYLTGFSGSAGSVIVGITKCAFFTDGRYMLQAKQQLQDKLFEIYNIAETTPQKWLNQHQLEIAYDPWLISVSDARKFDGKPVVGNLIDVIWPTKPIPLQTPARPHKIEFSGEESESKRLRVASQLNSDMALITSPDSLNWLLNIRGSDLKYTPVCLAYGVLHKNGRLDLYISKKKATFEILGFLGKDIKIKEPHQILEISKGAIAFDPAKTPYAIYQALAQNGVELIEERDPCLIPKSCKNHIEIEGIKKAHKLDGLALTKFINWIKRQKEADEAWAAIRLEEFRKENQEYKGASFNTISAFGANGAIVHYDYTKNSSPAKFEQQGLYLIDSGGQYEFGTTDVTRTIAFGDPTPEMKRTYTLVLKGHIAIATAKFPYGTTGSQLDSLARQFLWKDCLDYDHGTGHGVGCYLSVHEGPQSISKRGANVQLLPGMVLSNEPGYYKEGQFGIRIENLVLVKEDSNGFLCFETLTSAPLENALINHGMLTDEERDWVHDYQESVNTLSSILV